MPLDFDKLVGKRTMVLSSNRWKQEELVKYLVRKMAPRFTEVYIVSNKEQHLRDFYDTPYERMIDFEFRLTDLDHLSDLIDRRGVGKRPLVVIDCCNYCFHAGKVAFWLKMERLFTERVTLIVCFSLCPSEQLLRFGDFHNVIFDEVSPSYEVNHLYRILGMEEIVEYHKFRKVLLGMIGQNRFYMWSDGEFSSFCKRDARKIDRLLMRDMIGEEEFARIAPLNHQMVEKIVRTDAEYEEHMRVLQENAMREMAPRDLDVEIIYGDDFPSPVEGHNLEPDFW